MGIPSYFSYIVKQHRSIIRPYIKKSEQIDNLYLDSNSIIYDAVQHDNELRDPVTGLLDEQKLIDAVCEKLCYYIRLIEPSKRVFIAFDGIAPIAKMNQQRNRRYMSILLEEQRQMHEQDQKDKKDKKENIKWNTSAITPGTEFMKKLDKGIHLRFAGKEKAAEFGIEQFIISTGEEAGEGEHKIYEYIRQEKAYHKQTKTIIYGLDADLIMLTLNHLHISSELYLFRETPHFIQHIDKTLDPNGHYLMDINFFGDSIIREFTSATKPTSEEDPNQEIVINENKICDYIFMCFLLGNDFLPHFPALNIRTNGIQYLMNAYKFVFQTASPAESNLTTNKGTMILWKNVRRFIEYLSKNELTYLQGEYKKRDRMSKNQEHMPPKEEGDYLNLPLKERSIEKYINPFESGWETRYYQTLFDIKISDQKSKNISLNYLQGLEWTMAYYTTGCIDWRWKYNYHYPPLLIDLIRHVPYFNHTSLVTSKEKNPVSALVQLCYVLPERSLNLLPAKLHYNYLLRYQPDWYTSDCDLKWSFCKYLWEAHACLPEIDIPALEKLVANYS